MAGVTFDTGALIAAARNDRRFWAFWKWLTVHAPGIGRIRTLEGAGG